jgi:hypothetical protein
MLDICPKSPQVSTYFYGWLISAVWLNIWYTNMKTALFIREKMEKQSSVPRLGSSN